MVSLRGRRAPHSSCRKVGSEDTWNLVIGISKTHMGPTAPIRASTPPFLCEVLLKFKRMECGLFATTVEERGKESNVVWAHNMCYRNFRNRFSDSDLIVTKPWEVLMFYRPGEPSIIQSWGGGLRPAPWPNSKALSSFHNKLPLWQHSSHQPFWWATIRRWTSKEACPPQAVVIKPPNWQVDVIYNKSENKSNIRSSVCI